MDSVRQSIRDGVVNNLIAQYQSGITEPLVPTDLSGPMTTSVVDSFSNWLGGPVTLVYETGAEFYKVVPISKGNGNFFEKLPPANVKQAEAKSSQAKIPRPPNAWILYRQHHHASVRDANPGMMNVDLCKLSQSYILRIFANTVTAKIISQKWKAESPEARDTWHAKAAEAKAAHRLKYPTYSYSPRKPGEKRRRLTKRQAAYHAAMEEHGKEPVIKQVLTTGNVLGCDVVDNLSSTEPQFNIPFDDPMVYHMHFDTELPHPETTVVPVLDGLISTHNINNMYLHDNAYLAAFDVTASDAVKEQLDHTKALIPDIGIDFDISDDFFSTGNFNNFSPRRSDPSNADPPPPPPPPKNYFAEVYRQQELSAIAHTFDEDTNNQSNGEAEDNSETSDNNNTDAIDWDALVEF